MNSQRAPLGPWTDGHLIALVLTGAVGLVSIVVAWYGASGSANLNRQVTWLELAVAGTVTAALGNCVWLLRGRQAVGDRRRDLVAMTPAIDASPSVPRPAPTLPRSPYVQALGMNRVHLPSCPLVAGKDVRPATMHDGESCGVCRP